MGKIKDIAYKGLDMLGVPGFDDPAAREFYKLIKYGDIEGTKRGAGMKILAGGLMGAAATTGAALVAPVSDSYAGSRIQDIAVFDLEVDCASCSNQERLNKGAEAADKLARYLRENLDVDGVRIYRIFDKRSPPELSKNFYTDNFIVGVLTIGDSGTDALSMKLVDAYPINIPGGDKTYRIQTSGKDRDSALRSLADRITVDVGGEVNNKNFTVGPAPEKADKALKSLLEKISKR